MKPMTKTQQIKDWMAQEATWYSEHSDWPVSELAEESARRFDFRGQCSEDYAEFMVEKRWKQASTVFKQLGLNLRLDGEV